MWRNKLTVVLAGCWLLLTILSDGSFGGIPQLVRDRLPLVDTLEVLLQGSTVGTLVTSLSSHGDTTENRLALSVEMHDQSGTGSQHLELEELRKFAPSGAILSARQRMSSAAGVNTWSLTVDSSGAGYLSVTAAAVTTQRCIGSVHENIGSLLELYAGVFSNSMRTNAGWIDTAVELTSGERIISTTKCIELPSERNDSCWEFVCSNNLLQQREIWIMDRRGKTIFRDMYPYTGRKKNVVVKSARDTAVNVSLFEMMKIKAARPVDPQHEHIAVSFDNSQAIDTSVAPFFRQRGAVYVLQDLSRNCGSADAVPSATVHASYLAPTATLQCDHPAIKRLADSLRLSGSLPCETVGRYNHWVYTKLRKKNSPTFSSALETLKAGYGDCGEHAVLLAALLRASAIPARVVDGLIYVDAEKGYFYHAWVMAYAGGWVFADPSHDCFPAWRDRIPLVIDDDGSRLTALAKVIGRTSVTYIGKGGLR